MQQIKHVKNQQRKIQLLKEDLQQQITDQRLQLSPNAELCLLIGGGFFVGFLWQRIKLPWLLRQVILPSLGGLSHD